jgi:hypothetical protein
MTVLFYLALHNKIRIMGTVGTADDLVLCVGLKLVSSTLLLVDFYPKLNCLGFFYAFLPTGFSKSLTYKV